MYVPVNASIYILILVLIANFFYVPINASIYIPIIILITNGIVLFRLTLSWNWMEFSFLFK
jgi:hypothetical protein